MVGLVAGSALQLQQSALFSPVAYVAIAGAAVALAMVLGWWIKPARSRAWCVLALAMVLAWGCTGWRAAAFQQTAMPAAWEGRDVRVEGVIVDMPQTTARGVRMRFDIEQAWAQGMPIRLPEGVMLTWYGEPPTEGLQAGQRWAWTVRLKAPHGERNPHSMDWELWLWSQGVQATGYVRQHRSGGGNGNGEVAPPQWLAQTARAPVAQLRGRLLQAMQPPEGASAREQASWGVVQALVTGAQSRITRADWQLFRDTGVAHLVSISGLHITTCA